MRLCGWEVGIELAGIGGAKGRRRYVTGSWLVGSRQTRTLESRACSALFAAIKVR